MANSMHNVATKAIKAHFKDMNMWTGIIIWDFEKAPLSFRALAVGPDPVEYPNVKAVWLVYEPNRDIIGMRLDRAWEVPDYNVTIETFDIDDGTIHIGYS